MNKTTLATAALSVSVLLATVFAPVATAAPTDVTLSATARGQVVTVTINNRTGSPLLCAVLGSKAGSAPTEAIAFGVGLGDVATGGRIDPVIVTPTDPPLSFNNVAPGDYTIDWACTNNRFGEPGHEEWGTPAAISQQSTTQPTPVTVAALPRFFGSS